jgi:carboxyl-terminal processing protease
MSKKKILFLAMSVALMLSLLGGALFGQASMPKNNLYKYLSIFTEVFSLARNNYVEEVPSEQLVDGAFSGVTDAIDEFSYYIPPADMAKYKSFGENDESGSGLVVTKRFGYAFVIATIAGSPAEKAGIERGDFVEKIDGVLTQKMPVWQVRHLLRADMPVKLTVLRGGMTKRDEFTIKREEFHPDVTTATYGDISYIKIPFFVKATTADQFRAALENVRKVSHRKLVVDVRGNAGGDVDEAIHSADELLSAGLITGLEGKRVDATKWTADKATAFDGDLEVLTDQSTGGGAEIFAAAIHGNNRGKLVGVPTYGHSVVQKLVPLPSGGGVWMTVAHYITPEGKAIKEQGVKPDVLVDLTSQALRDPKDPKAKPKEDLILNRALALFAEPKIAAKKAA